MPGLATGGGLAALGFWLFLSAVVVAGIWYGARERQAQHETLRRMMERGQSPDPALIARLFPAGGNDSVRLARDLRVGGLVVLSAAPGLGLLGWLVGLQSPPWFLPLLGVAALAGCVSVGLLAASFVVGRRPAGPGASAGGALHT